MHWKMDFHFFDGRLFIFKNGEPLPVKGGNNSIENDFSKKKIANDEQLKGLPKNYTQKSE